MYINEVTVRHNLVCTFTTQMQRETLMLRMMRRWRHLLLLRRNALVKVKKTQKNPSKHCTHSPHFCCGSKGGNHLKHVLFIQKNPNILFDFKKGDRKRTCWLSLTSFWLACSLLLLACKQRLCVGDEGSNYRVTTDPRRKKKGWKQWGMTVNPCWHVDLLVCKWHKWRFEVEENLQDDSAMTNYSIKSKRSYFWRRCEETDKEEEDHWSDCLRLVAAWYCWCNTAAAWFGHVTQEPKEPGECWEGLWTMIMQRPDLISCPVVLSLSFLPYLYFSICTFLPQSMNYPSLHNQ